MAQAIQHHALLFRFFRGPLASLALALALALPGRADPTSNGGSRWSFPDAIVAPSQANGARIVRGTLTSAEQAGQIHFIVSLKMRNTAWLDQRIVQPNQRVPQADLEAYYLPALSEYNAVRDWFVSQGFTITRNDPDHAMIFLSGTVAQIHASLGATFARVATPDGEFTSAVTAPSLPADIADQVQAIVGLQPHVRFHSGSTRLGVFRPDVLTGVGSPASDALEPIDIMTDYYAPLSAGASPLPSQLYWPTTLNGSGQIIAVIMDATVSPSDLTAFYSAVGESTVATANNFTVVPVDGGPANLTSTNPDAVEAALDVEWASSIAPAAMVRLYTTPDLSRKSLTDACNQILDDELPVSQDGKGLNITVVSICASGPEVQSDRTSTLDQAFALFAANGISVLVSSGDGGSNPYFYSAGATPQAQNWIDEYPNVSIAAQEPQYPASDIYVTAVGGTMLPLAVGTNPATNNYVRDPNHTENTYSITVASPGVGPSPYQVTMENASGGGYSQVFPSGSWQFDSSTTSILAQATGRPVPDVSIAAAAVIGGPNGTPFGGLVIQNGTSYSAEGTSLSCPTWAGIVALINQSRTVAGTTPSAIGFLTGQLYPLPLSTTSPSNLALTDITTGTIEITSGSNGAYSSTTGYDLCTGLGTPNITDLIDALVSSSADASTDFTPPAPATAASSGGGGGAPSLWFYGALALLVAGRLAFRLKKAA